MILVGRVAVGARHPRRPAVARVLTIPWAIVVRLADPLGVLHRRALSSACRPLSVIRTRDFQLVRARDDARWMKYSAVPTVRSKRALVMRGSCAATRRRTRIAFWNYCPSGW